MTSSVNDFADIRRRLVELTGEGPQHTLREQLALHMINEWRATRNQGPYTGFDDPFWASDDKQQWLGIAQSAMDFMKMKEDWKKGRF